MCNLTAHIFIANVPKLDAMSYHVAYTGIFFFLLFFLGEELTRAKDKQIWCMCAKNENYYTLFHDKTHYPRLTAKVL